MNVSDLSELDIFYGDLTVNRALVYARLPRAVDDAGRRLSGQVRGPRCLHAETLPMTAPLADLGPGPTLLARALIPEPSFWSPDLPAIYDVTVNLECGSQIIGTVRREIGLRSLGVRGRYLVSEGKRWIVRGVTTCSTTAKLPRQWHESLATYVATDADMQPLAEASQWGALALVTVTERGEQAVDRLRDLARFPAVAIAAIDGPLPFDFKKSSVAPNLLLAAVLGADRAAYPHPWADLLLVNADNPAHLSSLAASGELPLIAVRNLKARVEMATARAACDALQRDLAPIGQFAGYIV